MCRPWVPGDACSMCTRMRTPPVGSSVKVAVPVTADPLLDSSVAFAVGPSGALAEAQPAQISAATAKHAGAALPIVFMDPPLLRGSYFERRGQGPRILPGVTGDRTAFPFEERTEHENDLSDSSRRARPAGACRRRGSVSLRLVPPAEVSRA